MNIQHHIQLLPFNSFRTQAVAKLFCEPKSEREVSEAILQFPHEKKLVLGQGCNLFFTQDFDGLILKSAIRGIRIISETTDYVDIEAGAAEDWDTFVEYCVSKKYAGIENLSLIPSSVGAAPVQNIGAYGAEVKDVITLVKAIDLKTGEARAFTNEECEFSYRNSVFKKTQRFVITSVIFRLNKTFSYVEKYVDLSHELQNTPNPSLLDVRQAVVNVRNRKLPNPNTLPNAGSFFKNPILTEEEKNKLLTLLPDAPIYNIGKNEFKTSAAYLIEKAGYKGKRKGQVGIYEHHALIIVNYGTENGKEIADFMHEVQALVSVKFNVALEPEVWIY